MEDLKKIALIANAQTKRFPNGNEVFKIISRLAEESGEVAWEVNHYERKGIDISQNAKEGKENFVKEIFQVMISLNQLLQYFNLEDDFKLVIDEVFKEYIGKGFLISEDLECN